MRSSLLLGFLALAGCSVIACGASKISGFDDGSSAGVVKTGAGANVAAAGVDQFNRG